MCGPIWNTVKLFSRSSVLDLGPERLKAVKLDSTVDDIEIENDVVRGVRVGNQIVKADIVILAGGVAGTGSLLCRLMDKLKSGKNENKIHGVKDHTNIRINVKSKKRVFTLNQLKLKFPKKIFFFLKYWKSLVSIIRGSGASSAANIDLYGDGKVSLRINLLRFHESGRLGSSGELFDNSDCGFSLSLTQVNPISRGFVDQQGTIHPGYLSSPEDMNFLTDALKYATNLLQTPPLSEYVDEIVNLDEILINPEKYIRENFHSGYHLIGGSADLIDSEFRVAGIQGLYCCDSSALSEYPSSNIHSSVVILAKAFAQRLVQTAYKE